MRVTFSSHLEFSQVQQKQQQEQLEQKMKINEKKPKLQDTSLVEKKLLETVNNAEKKAREFSHFGQVRTGNVNEKRNFWLRSATSTEALNETGSGNGPRRSRQQQRFGEAWLKQQQQDDLSARPGSSLGQMIGEQGKFF